MVMQIVLDKCGGLCYTCYCNDGMRFDAVTHKSSTRVGVRIHETMVTYSNWKNMNTRILRALKSGNDFTANQLRSKFGIRRVSDRISELRKAGYAIYLNTKTTRNGESIKVYRLGTPTRAQVSAGYFAQKSGTFRYAVMDSLNFAN